MLNDSERRLLAPIFDQVLNTTNSYNEIFQGFEIYITGSSLNLLNRDHNDVDIMVVIPIDMISSAKRKILSNLWQNFKDNEIGAIQQLVESSKIKLLGLNELIDSIIDSLEYIKVITTQDSEALLQRLGSTNEVTRINMDPDGELTAIRMRIEGAFESEKNNPILDSDGTAGYQLGTLVEEFLKSVANDLSAKYRTQDGQPYYRVQWHKSFTEGYGKIAGENNCHIYPSAHCVPVHLFLTTGVDNKKAMEKKESFTLEYYSDDERMKSIRLL